MAAPFTGDPVGFLPGTTTGSTVADATVMPIIAAALADGRDGDADLDGTNQVPWATLSGSTYTCIRIGLPRNLWVRVGITLKTAQFAGPWSSGDVLVDGTISANGNDAAAAVAGALTSAGTFPATSAGGAGGAAGADNAGAAAGAVTVEYPVAGRHNGAPGGNAAVASGGATAAVSALSATRGLTHGMAAALGIGAYVTNLGINTETCSAGGSGGAGHASGAGGGGGASGGMIHMSGRSLTVSSTGLISANGGSGAAGGTSAGGGSGGSGGRIRLIFGTVTLSDLILSVQVRGGQGGAAGATGGFYGNCGQAGEIMYLAGKPSPMATRHNRVTLTSAERTAAIVAGVLDASGSFIVGSDAGRATGVVGTATGGGGLSIFELATPDGEISLRFDASNFRLNLTVRGSVVLSTQALNSVTTPPCFGPFLTGDTIDWRIWYDPAGGARSMGIRWFVNRCGGDDEVGVASGSALAAATSGSALSTSTTTGSWGPAPSYIRAAKSANVVATVAIFGDSILASRQNSTGWDGVTVGSRLSWSTQVCYSFAYQGSTWANQLTAWQASPMRGNAAVVAVIVQVGHNDINAGSSAAVVTAAAESFIQDVTTNNPLAKRIVSKLSPSYSVWTAAQRAIWDTVQANYDGTGGSPVTADARATAHIATMGDSNKVLRERAENADFTHPNFWGRALNARSIAAAYDTTLLAR